MPFMKISQWGNWLQVEDLDGEKHWIAANHVAYGGQCVVVKTKQAVLRQGPGQKFLSTEFGQAEKYMAFKKINREAEWIQVEDDYHMKYWMNEKSLWLPIKTTRLEF